MCVGTLVGWSKSILPGTYDAENVCDAFEKINKDLEKEMDEFREDHPNWLLIPYYPDPDEKE